MKIIFPKPGEKLICLGCLGDVEGSLAHGEDGDCDFYFCETCVDFVDVGISYDA